VDKAWINPWREHSRDARPNFIFLLNQLQQIIINYFAYWVDMSIF